MGYFEGWYFKCCTTNKTIAFIPTYHCNHNKKTASLQIITDDTTVNIPFDTIEYNRHPLSAKLGNCSFSEQGIVLNYHDSNVTLKGSLHFQSLTPIRYDIMGPFAFVPFLQCNCQANP